MPHVQNSDVRGVLLAAGQGKRMKSALPKMLHQVLGKSILSRVLAALDELKLSHLHIIIGHEAEQMREYLEKNPPSTAFSIHLQDPQLGTGHAVMQVERELESFQGSLLVCPGDTPLLTTATLQSLISEHSQDKAAITMLTTLVEDPRNYGRIIRNEAGKVIRIVEDKDASAEEKAIKEINPAIYCLNWTQVSAGLKSLSNNNKQQEYYLTDLIGWAFSQKLSVSSSLLPDWREVSGINSRLELAQANRLLSERTVNHLMLDCGVTVMDPNSTLIAPEAQIGVDTTILPGCLLLGNIEIGSNCQIGPHTTINGPCKIGSDTTVCQSRISNCDIGSNCWIGPFAHLRDGVVIGNQARIGNFVEIKKSSLGEGTKISHLSYIGDSSVGKKVNLGAGTITANFDSLTKLKRRTVIGDGAATGCHAVLVAPVEVGNDAMVAAGTVITRDVPEGALAVGRARQENKPGWTAARRLKSQNPKMAP